VKDDVPAGERWLGIPAMPIRDWTREQSAIKKLVKTAANTSATGEHGS
jgi:UDP-3-O-[3-hydroxymyristoyl] glucosamine N-acyltransferase